LEEGIGLVPTAKDTVGSSYLYNVARFPEQVYLKVGPQQGTLAYQRLAWVPNPSKFILMHEPAARRWGRLDVKTCALYPWHYARRRFRVEYPGTANEMVADDLCKNVQRIPLKDYGGKFISPILFVDGHVATHDFTSNIRADPVSCHEETKDWMWYKPMPDWKRGK
jgi:prepilin-type processing-associated H-X9-DG protein